MNTRQKLAQMTEEHLKYETLNEIHSLVKELNWSFNRADLNNDLLSKMSLNALENLVTELDEILTGFVLASQQYEKVYEKYGA